jgi:ADP-ribose pyrophosphatase YjhB (NUDIX family)
MEKYSFQIRVAGVLIQENKLLLVKQQVNERRNWSLPGGRAETGETLEEAMVRELYEETGLKVKVNRLLYVCDKPDAHPPILHMTFLLDYVAGDICLPTNEFDANPIADVQFVDVSDLPAYGFTGRFMGLVSDGFPDAGNYKGLKENIGL